MNANLDTLALHAHFCRMVAAVEKPLTTRNPNGKLTAADQAQIRTRYLVRGEAPKEIATALNLPVGPIRDLVTRRGWTKLRAGRWADKSAETVAAMDADVERVMHEAAFTTEELLTGSGELARQVLDSKDTKGLSMVSTAMRNFAEIASKCRGRDGNNGSNGSSVNFFVLSAPPQREEKRVSESTAAPVSTPPLLETQKAIDVPASSCAVETAQSKSPTQSQ